MASEPQKPLSLNGELELERLRRENDKLRGTIEHMKKELGALADTQRKLKEAHTRLEDTFKRLVGEKPYKSAKRPS